jgi:hypothetical protein
MADYSITAVTRRVVYTGSAGTGPYSFSFPVIAQTDLAVYKDATKLTLTTDYTVTISSVNGTGSITLVVAATGSNRITIIGARTIERTTDFVTAGDLKAASLNEQLDSQIIMIQQLAEENKRTMKAPQYDPAAVEDGGTVNMVLPVATSRAGKLLAFDSSGNPVVGEDIGNWRGNWTTATSYTVRDLVKDSSNSNVYRVNTAHTSSGTTPLSSNANSAKYDLVVDAESAASSATAAAASASAAATSASASASSASASSSSASAASTSASNASTSASSASTAQTAAEAARDATLAAYDSFDDRYLGVKTSNPTLDNDGNALLAGSLYFNSVVPEMRLYTGSAWVAAYVSGASYLLTSNNLSELTATASTARTNIGLGSIATQAASAVAITGGSVNSTTIGATTASTGAFTTLSASGTATFSGALTATAAAYMGLDALTDAATIAVDMSLGNNFSVTLAGNRTLGNPTNLTVGQSGIIYLTQDATGSRTLAYSSYWKFPGGTAPTLTTTANAVDALVYTVRTSTSITVQSLLNIA